MKTRTVNLKNIEFRYNLDGVAFFWGNNRCFKIYWWFNPRIVYGSQADPKIIGKKKYI